MTIKNVLKKIPLLVKVKKILFPQQNDGVQQFLRQYFESDRVKTIVQAGANDGVMSDPLRPFFQTPGNYRAILIEPIPYYVEKLQELYKDRNDITIINAALGSENKTEKLYFIPPAVADLMNGEGPQNNWAHGQGSFDRDIVVHWIEENKFRGEEYRQKIPFFISSISSIDVSIKQAGEIMPITENLLMVIDVQGFELEVLKGINWTAPPSFIMLEDDLGKSSNLFLFLKSKGYKYICGHSDKVFAFGEFSGF